MEDFNFKKNVFLSFKKILFFILLIIVIISFYLFLLNRNTFKEDRVFSVEVGDSLRKISLNLKQNDLIKSRALFETFVIFYGGEKKILPGDYLLESNLNSYQIAQRIALGKKNLSPIKITIPEGFDIYEISEVFSLKLSSFNKDRFLIEASKKEGYLFPDTYFFFRRDDENVAMKAMLENYEKKISPLREEMKSLNKSEEDIITMASIIEKEASGRDDRELISGILWKRLEINMPLQVDAALITYREKGLPQKPIANPGLLAIKAAMYPTYSDYLFYIHGKDGNTYFAKTYDEHKKNINKYLR